MQKHVLQAIYHHF